MIKEIKYLSYVITICLFIFFSGKYYFSNENKKNSFRSIDNILFMIDENSKKLLFLKNDTKNIIEFKENTLNTKHKKYRFWELIKND